MRRLSIFALPFRGRDEFLPLRGNPAFEVRWVSPHDFDGDTDVIILPGSARTIADLQYLREAGGERLIRRHLANGGRVVGVCGGYQMLGVELVDNQLKQGDVATVPGLGLIPITTVFGPKMMRSRTTAEVKVGRGTGGNIVGEEIRSGFSFENVNSVNGPQDCRTLATVTDRHYHEPCPEREVLVYGADRSVIWHPGSEPSDGLVTNDWQIWGTYIHLVFHSPSFVSSFFEGT